MEKLDPALKTSTNNVTTQDWSDEAQLFSLSLSLTHTLLSCKWGTVFLLESLHHVDQRRERVSVSHVTGRVIAFITRADHEWRRGRGRGRDRTCLSVSIIKVFMRATWFACTISAIHADHDKCVCTCRRRWTIRIAGYQGNAQQSVPILILISVH